MEFDPNQHTQTVTLEDGTQRDVLQYPRGWVTGSLAVSCEKDGEMYIAVCSRPGEEMTMSGTSTRFNHADGTPNPGGAHATPLESGVESLKHFFGLDLSEHNLAITPNPAEPLHVRSPGVYKGEYLEDMRQPQPGFGGNKDVQQIDIAHGAHIKLEKGQDLPELKGADHIREGVDSTPTWLNVKNVELVQEDGRTFYRYNADDNPLVPKGMEVLNKGGGHIMERLIAKARDLPFMAQGLNGHVGHIFQQMKANNVNLRMQIEKAVEAGALDETFKPHSQVGQAVADFYDAVTADLEKGRGQGR